MEKHKQTEIKVFCHAPDCTEYTYQEYDDGFIDKWFCDEHDNTRQKA